MRALFSLAVLFLAGCTGFSEQPVLTQFFASARLRDLTALQNISTVVFEPHIRGTVTAFDITGVSPENRAPIDPAANGELLELSLGDRKSDRSHQTGEIVTKRVTVSAPVRLPTGETQVKTLYVQMQRAVLTGQTGGRWIITGIDESEPPPPRKALWRASP
jgi:hypothetical protein